MFLFNITSADISQKLAGVIFKRTIKLSQLKILKTNVPKMDATTDTGPSIKERRLGARAEGGL